MYFYQKKIFILLKIEKDILKTNFILRIFNKNSFLKNSSSFNLFLSLKHIITIL